MLFIDKLKIFVESGNGGDGCVSFRREKFIPRGGPNGGNGGHGGSVILVASKDMNTFYKLSFHPHCKAERGRHGQGNFCTGATGEDQIVQVPLGTLVYELAPESSGKENSRVELAELLEEGQRLLVAQGGRGGRGNTTFKSSTNRAPKQREVGGAGEKKTLELELKLLANVGLVGFPNAGKSTLLARLTNAKPKVADYPFTTLNPVLGLCWWKNRSFVIADLPGLIEGAHKGRGLGDEFLRHVERTSVLVHLVDPEGFNSISPKKGLQVLERELKLWNPALLKKPRLVAVTKKDLGSAALQAEKTIRKSRKKTPLFAISAHTGEGLEELLNAVLERLNPQG